MAPDTLTVLRIGDWRVDPAAGTLTRGSESAALEARSMRLLLALAARAGQVVSVDELLNEVWPDVAVSPDSVYQAVASLRRVLGDDARQPVYIATAPRLGYRMVAAVAPWTEEPADDSPVAPFVGRRPLWLIAAAAVLLAAAVSGFLLRGRLAELDQPHVTAQAAPPQQSIAVLPFLDLTEGMSEGEFTDGMTEELIDRLSQTPGLHVPPPTASFFYKDKQVSVADVARALSVAWVVEGSVRKSGNRVRVSARLVRADSGYVAWTQTFDRPFGDRLMVQDEIAGAVVRALQAGGALKNR